MGLCGMRLNALRLLKLVLGAPGPGPRLDNAPALTASELLLGCQNGRTRPLDPVTSVDGVFPLWELASCSQDDRGAERESALRFGLPSREKCH